MDDHKMGAGGDKTLRDCRDYVTRQLLRSRARAEHELRRKRAIQAWARRKARSAVGRGAGGG